MRNMQSFFLLIITSIIALTLSASKAKNTNDLLTDGKTELVNAEIQDCDTYFPLSKGTTFEMTTYNKKGKANAVSNYEITDSKDIENGIVATTKMNIEDKKGNPGFEMTYEAKCQDGKYYLNLENMFSELTSQYKAQGMDVSIENGISVVPNNLAVNDQLEDATMIMNMSSSPMNMKFTIIISERIVTGKETITTPAGTFDCLILSQKITTKMGKMMTVTTSSKEWLSKGVGTVKSENYNKGGKMEGYSLLTKFSK